MWFISASFRIFQARPTLTESNKRSRSASAGAAQPPVPSSAKVRQFARCNWPLDSKQAFHWKGRIFAICSRWWMIISRVLHNLQGALNRSSWTAQFINAFPDTVSHQTASSQLDDKSWPSNGAIKFLIETWFLINAQSSVRPARTFCGDRALLGQRKRHLGC